MTSAAQGAVTADSPRDLSSILRMRVNLLPSSVERGGNGDGALQGSRSQETKEKRSFSALSHRRVLPESSRFISPARNWFSGFFHLALISEWSEIHLRQISDTEDLAIDMIYQMSVQTNRGGALT